MQKDTDWLYKTELADPLPLDELTRLVQEYRDGVDHSDKLIQTHMRLAMFYAWKFTKRASHKYDVLQSTALFALCEAVKKYPEKATNNSITAYIRTYIKFALLHELQPDYCGTINPRSVRRRRDSCVQIEEIVDENLTTRHYFGLDDREIIEYACKNERESQMLELEIQGYKRKEIAAKLDICRDTVRMTLETIYTRMRDKLNA